MTQSVVIPSIAERLEKAVRLESLGELEQARARYRAVLDQNPEAPEALSLLGQLECRLGDHNAAVFHLRRAARLAPGRPDIHLGLGNALLHAGENRAAAASCLAAVQVDPLFAPGYVSLGKIFNQNGQHAKALQAFERARELDPSYPEVHYELGVFFQQRDRLEPAIAAFLNCLRLHAGFQDADFKLAELFILKAAFSDALIHLQKHLKEHPHDADGWTAQAVACLELGLHDEAINSCQLALQQDPRHSPAFTQLGRINFARDDQAGAKRAYVAAIAADGQNSLAHTGLAEVYAAQGQCELALKQISRAGDPQDHGVHTALVYGRILAGRGLPDQAIRLLVKRLERRCDSVAGRRRCHYALGELFATQGHPVKAFRHYQNANNLQAQSFNVGTFSNQTNRIIGFYTPRKIARLSRAKPRIQQPVFIAGLPGVAMQLIRGLLSQHTDTQISKCRLSLASIAAELPSYLASALEYPEVLSAARASELEVLATRYRQENFANEQPVLLLDQSADNWLHLGLGALLFPGMRVIHVVTSPLFAAMDIYTHELNAPGFSYASSLRDIGLQTRKFAHLMGHWRGLGEFDLLELRLDSMLRNPDAMSRRLFAFAGLDWRPGVMEYFECRTGNASRLQNLRDLSQRYEAFAPFAKSFV